MINESLQSLFRDTKTVNKATITVSVEMKPSALMKTLSVEVLKELSRIVPYSGFKDVDDLTVDDVHAYICTLVWMRCQNVNEAFTPDQRAYRSMFKHLSVPVMVYQLLVSIGVAVDRDYSIEFRPEYSISESDLLAPEEMRAISDVLLRLEPNGMKIVHGLPIDREGELDFMALCHVETEVCGYRHSHPVYGFLAAFFRQKEFNEVTGNMCRVTYGYDTDYDLYVTQVFRKLNADS